MIRGVEFEIPQKTTDSLWKILNCIKIDAYHWKVVENQEEVWSENGDKEFFDIMEMNGKDFAKKIQLNHFIVFVKLQAYYSDGKFQDISTYNDFINGDCQLLLLVSDCEYVEIYCKDEEHSKVIYHHALLQNYKNVKYITDKNDSRITMNVL